MAPSRRPPPRDLAELLLRANALAGRALGEVGAALGVPLDGAPARTKGLVGQLLERALGASGGSAAGPDFADLGVELKTVPVGAGGVPTESTFVCTIQLAEAAHARWATSTARAKLARVLFVPVEAGPGALPARRILAPRLVCLTEAQEAVLRADFEDLMGRIGVGGVDGVTGHEGRWLQVRPKAATAAVRTLAPDGDGGLLESGPRGFYLRARFVAAVLEDPAATP